MDEPEFKGGAERFTEVKDKVKNEVSIINDMFMWILDNLKIFHIQLIIPHTWDKIKIVPI